MKGDVILAHMEWCQEAHGRVIYLFGICNPIRMTNMQVKQQHEDMKTWQMCNKQQRSKSRHDVPSPDMMYSTWGLTLPCLFLTYRCVTWKSRSCLYSSWDDSIWLIQFWLLYSIGLSSIRKDSNTHLHSSIKEWFTSMGNKVYMTTIFTRSL